MRIIDIRETAIPLKSNLKNSSFDFSEMTTSIVAVVTDVVRSAVPVVGFAFNSTGRYACGAQMRERFERVLAAMTAREKVGGDAERSIPIGTIEVAVWDAVAKIAGQPLHRVLADRYGGGRLPDKVFCYVGGGWYWPGQTVADLQDEMRRHLAAGYTMIKMKVGGLAVVEDCRRIEAVLQVLGSEHRLAVDANGKFDRAAALAYAEALKPFGLKWFEEPCHPLDYALYAEVAAAYDAPLATGENLYSTEDVQNLVQFGGRKAGAERTSFPMAATRCRSPSQPASGLAAPNPIRACSVRSAALRMTPRWRTDLSPCRIGPASVSKGRPSCIG